jgi:transcriptional regulator with XRE-family HTH domain
MTDERQRDRLSQLLLEMLKAGLTQRVLARKIGISYASVQAYVNGDQYPRMESKVKIAAYKGWTLEELEAYLEDRPVKAQDNNIDEFLQGVRTMTPGNAAKVAKAALDRVLEAAGDYQVTDG